MADKTKGWISIYRSIRDHWLWTEEVSFDRAHAWIDLLLDANFEDKRVLINGKVAVIKRGQKWTSVRTLADRWGWSKNKVVAFLDLLQADNMVAVEGTPNGTLLTIVNYEDFQNQRDTDRDTEGTLKGQSRDTEGTPTGQNNNINNINNINNKIIKGRFTPPTIIDVQTYCIESGHQIDANAFVDFYSSKNWMVGKNKMKDWKAAVRNWERHDRESGMAKPQTEQKPRSSFQNFTPSGMDWNAAFDQILYNQ